MGQKFCLHSKLHFYFKFYLIKNPDLSALIFGLTEVPFNERILSLQHPKKNMTKQQERSPFTTAGKSFERIIFCTVITFEFTRKARLVKIYHFSYIYTLIL